MATLLIADDDPVIVKLLSTCLRHEGHNILAAADGEEAMETVRRERPDLVVLEVNMPRLDGFRVLHRIRRDPELRRSPVVMLTGRETPEDVTLGFDLGADFYLAKPVHPQELSALVRRFLLTATPPGRSPQHSLTA